jgi:hypothetical protein
LKPASKASTDLPVMRIYEAQGTPFSVYNSDNARLLNLFRFGIKLDASTNQIPRLLRVRGR